MSLSLFAGLGVLFGAPAGAIAYIIFYREYQHHFVDASKVHAIALRGAVTAFVFFVAFSILAGFVITRFVAPEAAGGP